MAEIEIGKISHYFGKIGVAAIDITAGELKVGDTIHIKGPTSDFTQTVDSMEVEHENVESAKPGDSVGLKVTEHARVTDTVYLVTED
ncbi:MAG: translation elongation factor-like protein [Candidatus Eisenbacteria sp.]|nr:translation elongation factor-like protein [Candidatus Eisenbacteria bacterium]